MEILYFVNCEIPVYSGAANDYYEHKIFVRTYSSGSTPIAATCYKNLRHFNTFIYILEWNFSHAFGRWSGCQTTLLKCKMRDDGAQEWRDWSQVDDLQLAAVAAGSIHVVVWANKNNKTADQCTICATRASRNIMKLHYRVRREMFDDETRAQ